MTEETYGPSPYDGPVRLKFGRTFKDSGAWVNDESLRLIGMSAEIEANNYTHVTLVQSGKQLREPVELEGRVVPESDYHRIVQADKLCRMFSEAEPGEVRVQIVDRILALYNGSGILDGLPEGYDFRLDPDTPALWYGTELVATFGPSYDEEEVRKEAWVHNFRRTGEGGGYIE